jgi:hypothetical protein
MARSQYVVANSAAVALSAATARTALAVLAPAQFGVDLLKFSIGFDGVTASAVPVFWELCSLTAATNSTPGTGNTSESASIIQISGRSITTGFTAFGASTSEPTVLAAIRKNYLTPAGGLLVYDFPLGDSPDSAVSQGFALRLTAPATVNVRCDFQFARA